MEALYLVMTRDDAGTILTVGVNGEVFSVQRKYPVHATQVVALVAWIAATAFLGKDHAFSIVDLMDAAEALV